MNTDRIVSISAIVVAIGTLIIIMYQTSLMRTTERASVMPYLQISYSNDGTNSFIALLNRGVGPAIISRITIHYGEEVIEGDPYQFFMKAAGNLEGIEGLYVDRVLAGMLIPSGEFIRTIGSTGSEQISERIVNLFSVNGIPETGTGPRGIIEIEYQSIYGDRWVIQSNELVPEEI